MYVDFDIGSKEEKQFKKQQRKVIFWAKKDKSDIESNCSEMMRMMSVMVNEIGACPGANRMSVKIINVMEWLNRSIPST